jgi:hypothetical protein
VDIPEALAKCWTVSGATFCDNRESTGNRGGGGSGTTSSTPSGPSPEELKQQRERTRLKAKAWYSDEAMDYFDRKDWDNAVRSFEEALERDPDDPDLNDWLKRAKAEKEKSRRPVVAAPSRPAPGNDSNVVDTRGVPRVGDDLLARVPELRNSPEAETIRKGYQALLNRDWQVALAWWQDALNRDPKNAALKRSVDLAKWMVDRQKEVRPGPVRLFSAANAATKRGDFDRALQLLQQIKTTNPAMTASADRMIEEIQKRRANLQLPDPKEAELTFYQTPYARAITAVTQTDYSRAIDLLGQAKRDNPAAARTIDTMIANVRLLSPVQLPEAEDSQLMFPERTYAGPMSGAGLELLADGYSKKAREIFDRLNLALVPKKR